MNLNIVGIKFVNKKDPKDIVSVVRVQKIRHHELITIKHPDEKLQLMSIEMFRKEYTRQWKAQKESKDLSQKVNKNCDK